MVPSSVGLHILVWPHIARYRETISAIPPNYALWGFWCLNMANWAPYPGPFPFSERFPIGEHAKWRCDTPPQKGYLSDTCAIPYETRQKGATPPSAILSRKGIARYGGYLAVVLDVAMSTFPVILANMSCRGTA